MNTTLEVKKRELKSAVVRAAGDVPAVVYGPKQETINVAVEKSAFEKILRDAGESTIISLVGLDDDIEVLIHDVSFNPARGGVEHVDFYAIERGKELTTNVPLEFIGEAPVEKTGATVNKVLHDIEVTCRPSNLPANIEVDLSMLVAESDQIQVKDLVVPEDVKLSAEPDDVIVTVASARAEEVDEVTETPDMNSIEVESKGKVEEESAE